MVIRSVQYLKTECLQIFLSKKTMSIDVLITRPKEQAEEFAVALEARGLRYFIEPVLDIIPTDNAPPSLRDVSGIIFTSVNAVRYGTNEAQKRIPVYTVGKRTAIEAEKKGYKDIRMVAPTVDLLQKKLKNTSGTFLYVRGKNVRTDLKKTALPCEEWIVYEARKRPCFSDAFLKKIKEERVDAVTFFSARTAEAFIALCKQENLTESFASTKALCLSKAVQTCACRLRWGSVHLSEMPDAFSLLALIDKEVELKGKLKEKVRP